MTLLLIALGGALGTLLRYSLSVAAARAAPALFPFGTFAINAIGCLAFGFVIGASHQRFPLSTDARLFLLVGVLGGFTTFSTYAYEGLTLLQNGDARLRAFVYVAGHVVAGLAAVWIGFRSGIRL